MLFYFPNPFMIWYLQVMFCDEENPKDCDAEVQCYCVYSQKACASIQLNFYTL